jgi:DNA-binding XRE family transcriptional regulator
MTTKINGLGRTFNALRRLRQTRNPPLRQRDVAARVGCTQSDVSAYERGDVLPDLPMALALASSIGCAVEEVFFDLHERVLASMGARLTAAANTTDAAVPSDAAAQGAVCPSAPSSPSRAR